jgi:competence protein ComEC
MCVGIISGLYFKPDTIVLSVFLFISVSGFIVSLRFNKSYINLLYGCTLTFTLYLSGLLLYTIEKKRLSELEPTSAEYICSLSEYPEEKGNSYSAIVKLSTKVSQEGIVPVQGSLLVYFRKDPILTTFLPGDILKMKCSPEKILNRGNPNEFDYRFNMENHGIKYFAFADAGDITGHLVPKHRKLIHSSLITREKIISMYKERGIRGDTLALVAAITLGQKNMLDPEQKQHFIKAGIMHIMAVSGLHAVILSLFVFNLLFFLKGRLNFLRSLITILFLWMFAFITGLTPSVLRATIMFTFLQGGQMMQRKVNSINSVLASAFVLFLIRPSVLFDAGFLLSYSAVIFIIRFYQQMYLKLDLKNWLADKIWQSAVVTIVAQAGTLPLTVMLFNRFPTWFILTNIVIVPLSSLLIIIGCLVPMTFHVEFISRPLATLLGNLTGITEMLTEKAASLPFSTISNIGMKPFEAMLLFIFLFMLMWYILNRRSVSVLYPAVALLILTISHTFKDISNRISNEIIVYNTIGSTAIGIRTGKVLNLYTDTSLLQPEVLRHCSTRNLKPVKNLIVNNFTVIKIGEVKILITNFMNNTLLQKANPDNIVLTGMYPKIEREIKLLKPAKSLIITGNVLSAYRIEDKFFNALADTIHYTRKSGAFRLKI